MESSWRGIVSCFFVTVLVVDGDEERGDMEVNLWLRIITYGKSRLQRSRVNRRLDRLRLAGELHDRQARRIAAVETGKQLPPALTKESNSERKYRAPEFPHGALYFTLSGNVSALQHSFNPAKWFYR